jgi:hypothetical protein
MHIKASLRRPACPCSRSAVSENCRVTVAIWVTSDLATFGHPCVPQPTLVDNPQGGGGERRRAKDIDGPPTITVDALNKVVLARRLALGTVALAHTRVSIPLLCCHDRQRAMRCRGVMGQLGYSLPRGQ